MAAVIPSIMGFGFDGPSRSPGLVACLPAGMGSNGVTVTKFLQFLMTFELYLELSYSYILSQLFIVVTVTEVTKVPKFLT